MSGILDNKTRVLDTILTDEGKEQLARGELNLRYYSFTDGCSFYESDVISGSTDATKRIYLEAFNLPYDKITPISDDSGVLNSFISAVGVIRTGSVHVDPAIVGNDLPDSLEFINSASIDSLKKQQIIGTYDKLFEQDTFAVDYSNISIGIKQDVPIIPVNHDIDINIHPSVFSDPHLSYMPNLQYLPPVTRSINGDIGSLGNYPKNSDFTGRQTFEQVVGDTIKIAKEQQNYRTISFDPTSNDNTLFSQMFELSGSVGQNQSAVNKLFAIDFGLHQLEDRQVKSHVFFVGKLFLDDKGTETFFRIFTLLFE